MTDLATMIPQPVTVAVGGREVAVTPIKVRELPAFASVVEPLLQDITSGAGVAALMTRDVESLIKAVAIGARLERAFVDDLELDELLNLAAAVLEVNADFFVRRLAPALNLAVERIGARVAGSMLSSGSSPTGTSEPT